SPGDPALLASALPRQPRRGGGPRQDRGSAPHRGGRAGGSAPRRSLGRSKAVAILAQSHGSGSGRARGAPATSPGWGDSDRGSEGTVSVIRSDSSTVSKSD